MVKKIILWRHGQTEYNLSGRVQGQSDIPLNEHGLKQAQAGALVLAKSAPSIVVSSDLSRAYTQAQILAKCLGVEVITDTRLRERGFGLFEGLTSTQLMSQYGEYYQAWKQQGECTEARIETRAEVGQRVAECVNEYADKCADTLVIVSHGSALTQGCAVLLGLDPLAWQGLRGLDNAHWSELLPSGRFPQWRLSAHNVGVKE